MEKLIQWHSVKCPRCDGMAMIGWGRNEQWCPFCHGTGIVLAQRVELPVGLAAQERGE